MKLILRFLKPHWKLCLVTFFLLIVDVVGALIIPTFASEIMKEGSTGAPFQTLANTAIAMAAAALISGAGGILSAYFCAELVSRGAKDMRDSLYKKSLELAVADDDRLWPHDVPRDRRYRCCCWFGRCFSLPYRQAQRLPADLLHHRQLLVDLLRDPVIHRST